MSTKEADLAAIAAQVELNCTVASTHFADDPIVAAAIVLLRTSYEAFLAAVVEADAARGFRRISTGRHVRRACAALNGAHATLRQTVEAAEHSQARRDEYGYGNFVQDALRLTCAS